MEHGSGRIGTEAALQRPRPPVDRAAIAARVGRTAAVVALGAVLAVAAAIPAARAAEHEEPRVVSVGGQGEVRAQPDRATVTLGVLARRPTVEAARQEANRVQAALLGVTRGLGIADAQVRSTRINVSPEYTWNEARRQREFAGYLVQRQIVVDHVGLSPIRIAFQPRADLTWFSILEEARKQGPRWVSAVIDSALADFLRVPPIVITQIAAS